MVASAGCGGADGESPEIAAPPAVQVPLAFSFEGIPGPWWRERATRSDFDADLRTCRDRSSLARETAVADERLDKAYREFLTCMQELAWTRGHPPSHPPKPAG